MKTQCFEVFGLALESGVKVPGHQPMPHPAEGESVSLEFGAVPQALKTTDYRDEVVQANATEYLICIPGLLRMYIEGGRRILVEPIGQANLASTWGFILGAGIAMVGLQRGLIPLHASSVATDAGCVAFAGQSSAGKSTLAALLVEQGYPLHGDDLCLLCPPNKGAVMVASGIRELRLKDDAAALFHFSTATDALLPDDEKVVFRPALGHRKALPLSRIYVLEFADGHSDPEITAVRGLAALQALLGSLRMRSGLLRHGHATKVIPALAAICETVPVFRFVRPRNRDRIREGSRHLAEHFERSAEAA